MAEWYIASCQISVARISLLSTLAFSAVSLALLTVASSSFAAAPSVAASCCSSDGASSQRIRRNSGAHQRRRALPQDAITAPRAAGAALLGTAEKAIGPRQWMPGAAVGAIGGRMRVAMDENGTVIQSLDLGRFNHYYYLPFTEADRLFSMSLSFSY